VLVVSLHRPESVHARDQVMREELSRLWQETAGNRDAWAVVMTGSGGRYFCAGRRDRLQGVRVVELLADLPQPTIAAINGFALGGGLEMALACDVRVIAEDAHIAKPDVSRGLVPAGGGTQRLPRIIGYARAFELILSGCRLTGKEAVA